MEFLLFVVVAATLLWVVNMIDFINKENKMKRETFEANKANRAAQNKFEELLVKLEEEYGSETGAPHVHTHINRTDREVWFNETKISGLQDARLIVKEAQKKAEEAIKSLLERDSRVPELEPVVEGGMLANFKLAGQNLSNEMVVGVSIEDAENVNRMWEWAEEAVLHNMVKFIPVLTNGRTFYEATKVSREKLDIAKEALEVFAANAEKKRLREETGEWLEYDIRDFPWSTFAEVNKEISHRKKEIQMFSARAKEHGYEPTLIEIGETYSKNISAKKAATSHPQRTAAMRLGRVFTDPVTFTVINKTQDPKKYIIEVDGQPCVAAITTDDAMTEFYVKSFFPILEDEYFAKNEWMDEFYQDNPDVDLNDLVALGLHSNYGEAS